MDKNFGMNKDEVRFEDMDTDEENETFRKFV